MMKTLAILALAILGTIGSTANEHAMAPEDVEPTTGALGFWSGNASFTTEPFETSGPIEVSLGAWCFEGIGFVSVMALDADGEMIDEIMVIGEGVESGVMNTGPGTYTLDIRVSHFHIYNWRVLVESAEAAGEDPNGAAADDDAERDSSVPDGALADDPISILDGVFSADQVTRGAAAYRTHCSGCHGDELVSIDPYSPDLVGPAFNARWHGQTIAQRFSRIKATMPLNQGGSLDDETYLDIITYILEANRYPTGDTDLELNLDHLERIVIEPR